MRTLSQGLEGGSVSSRVALVDLTTPEPTHDGCWSNVSTPDFVPVADLGTREPCQLRFNPGQPVSDCKSGRLETNGGPSLSTYL